MNTHKNGRAIAPIASDEVNSRCCRPLTTAERTITLKAESPTPATIQGPILAACPTTATGGGGGTGAAKADEPKAVAMTAARTNFFTYTPKPFPHNQRLSTN
jgi:hypothetical protein